MTISIRVGGSELEAKKSFEILIEPPLDELDSMAKFFIVDSFWLYTANHSRHDVEKSCWKDVL